LTVNADLLTSLLRSEFDEKTSASQFVNDRCVSADKERMGRDVVLTRLLSATAIDGSNVHVVEANSLVRCTDQTAWPITALQSQLRADHRRRAIYGICGPIHENASFSHVLRRAAQTHFRFFSASMICAAFDGALERVTRYREALPMTLSVALHVFPRELRELLRTYLY
jgi:hypothetical protein